MGKKIRTIVLRVLISVLTAAVLVVVLLMGFVGMVCKGKSDEARKVFVSTMLETGALTWMPSVFLSGEEIEQIMAGNKREPFDLSIDSSLIKIEANTGAGGNAGGAGGNQTEISGQGPTEPVETKDIEIETITARTFFATMMIIKDPSRVSVAAPYCDYNRNFDLKTICEKYGAVAGVNGGLYKNSSMTGNGRPMGVVISGGKILLNRPDDGQGIVLIYMTDKNILFYTSIDGWSTKDVEDFVKKEGIRDAICFQEEQQRKLDHFVPLIVNNIPREIQGTGSGMNPRTCIGQRADGSILMLVTDGRGSGSHLGASAADLIEVMQDYGAVNAFNIDGGSSACMYYEDDYLMASASLMLANTSWTLPDGWIVK